MEGEDFESVVGLPVAAGEFDESVVGFGTGVTKKGLAGLLGDFFANELGEFGLLRDMVEVGAVEEGLGLIGNGLGEVGVAVSEGAGGDAGAEVEELVVVLVPDVCALASGNGDGEAAVGVEDEFLCLFGDGHLCGVR